MLHGAKEEEGQEEPGGDDPVVHEITNHNVVIGGVFNFVTLEKGVYFSTGNTS
jgi:hypothetical protein